MSLNRSKVLYLTHPYTSVGEPLDNILDSAEVADTIELNNVGVAIVNPLEIVPAISDDDTVAMEYCKYLLNMCDGLVLSRQWWLSKNCRTEAMWAVEKDLDLYLCTDGGKLILVGEDALDLETLEYTASHPNKLAEGVVNSAAELHKKLINRADSYGDNDMDTLRYALHNATDESISNLMEEQLRNVPIEECGGKIAGGKFCGEVPPQWFDEPEKPITYACVTIDKPTEIILGKYSYGTIELKIIPHDGSANRILQL